MRRSPRCGLHPLLAVLAVSAGASVLGIGVQLWLDPRTSALAVTCGAVAGMLVSHASGHGVLVGLGVGAAIGLVALGVRALASFVTTFRQPPSTTSSGLWFSR